jgi:hypothetical protein
MLNLNPELLTKDGKPIFAVIPYEQFLAINGDARRLSEFARFESR